ncbi:PREDICTED: probable LRR receptor-like serine/threonine-protein kinase At4g36180 isoform X3 [Ipomoea nil]|uniref:probable LRR receptor-like serine/threonine-protein kinase At4g36180 isoform X3 n=1 Tax=Ipomoea nil TaxID=35883 RepID=UPI00090178CC|nr:PREDICTED: probable LRR receptor-like serine/threonine-protein kinase At4g36180 isoform X3 [Ipomoea nil]
MLSKSIFLQPSCVAMRMLFTTTTTLLPPFLYLFIFVCLSSSSSCAFTQRVAAKNNMIRCIERERLALLDFKQGLVDEYGVLSSWGSDDIECCNWWGVHCNNTTAHVTKLDLHAHFDNYGSPVGLSGHKVSPSLLELKHLNYLDLSFNDFQGSPIPGFIGSFKRLRVLSLMNAGFSGTIPPQLGNLTNLGVLNISEYYYSSNLKIKNIEWLSLLSSLRSIYLSGVDIESSKTSVTLPPFLEKLQLPFCELHGSLPPFSLNSSSPFLSVVDFSYNNINTSSVSHLLRNASKKLTTIDLSGNYFADTIPDGDMEILENLYLDSVITEDAGIPKSFWNLTHLRILSLRTNFQLNASIAELFQKLLKDADKSLQILDLTESKFTGELPADINTRFTSLRELRAPFNQLNGSIFRLPSSLEYLDLSYNQITGQIPDLLHVLSLREVYLSENQITGQIPDLSHALSLRRLDVSENQLQGGLPETIGKLSKLEELHASSNLLEGDVTETHFSNLTNLLLLDLSNNVALSFNLSSNWIPPFQLRSLSLAKCKVGPQFPKWLQTQSKLFEVDISSGGISGIIPNWFWNMSKSYRSLNLSYNNIGGRLPHFLPPIIDLSSNIFWGPILINPQEASILHLSNNKFVGSISFLCSISSATSIDLSYNQLSGEIPDCWNKSFVFDLSVLNLANNRFSGKIPHSLGSLLLLESLHLRNNNLIGELPSSLQNCTSLSVVDFGGNKFTGRIPSWIGGSLKNLLIVSLRHNKFYGKVPSSICHLKSIHILDLSKNKLTEKIPLCFNNFTYLMQASSSVGSTMQKLLLNSTSFQGGNDYYIDNILIQWKNQEWEYRKQLGLLKVIDLSSNRLIGDVPEELYTLKGLILLNLSNNHLTGKIFVTIYQMENLEVLDLSQNQLSGEIPVGLARLNYLDVLDLSNNFLSGKIPTGTQLQSFNVSSYAGNIGLCGDPLPKCSANVPPQHNKINDYQESDTFLDRGFYISMVLGFSLSFWGIVVTLVLKNSWKTAYYEFLNDVKDWLYVKVKIYLGRLQQKLRRTR